MFVAEETNAACLKLCFNAFSAIARPIRPFSPSNGRIDSKDRRSVPPCHESIILAFNTKASVDTFVQ